jgi:hypothetical protein
MRTFLLCAGLLLLLASPAAAADITFDRTSAGVAVGERVTLSTRITNPGADPTTAFVAHLDIVSLTPDVTVDPEDWSSERSQDVEALEPGGATTLSWPIQAVAAGSFDAYVVLAPTGDRAPGAGPLLVTTAPVHVEVAGRRALDAGGALPVVLAMPVLLGLGAAAMRYRLRGIH